MIFGGEIKKLMTSILLSFVDKVHFYIGYVLFLITI